MNFVHYVLTFVVKIIVFYSSNYNYRNQSKKRTWKKKSEEETDEKIQEMDPKTENEKDEELDPDGEVVESEAETPVIRREVCLFVCFVQWISIG